MKNTIGFIAFLLIAPTAFAQTTSLPGVAPAAGTSSSRTTNSPASSFSDPNVVGVAAAVKGSVEAVGPNGTRPLESGDPLYLGDEIRTDAAGHLQVLLRDETVFTLGAESAISLDEFIYDPSTQAGKVSTKIVKGVFRFVSGKIAKTDPKDMNVDLPVGSIGIRGTIVAGKVSGESSRVILLGPGENNNAGTNPGAIVVENQVNGQTQEVTINRTNFGTTIEGSNTPPSMPSMVAPQELGEIAGSLQPPQDKGAAENEAKTEPQGGPGSSATSLAGQDTFGAVENIMHFEANTEQENTIPPDVNQELGAGPGANIFKGKLVINHSGVTLYQHGTSSVVGSYTINYNVDMDRQKGGGTGSYVSGSASNVDSGDSFYFNLPEQNLFLVGDVGAVSYEDLTDTAGTVTADATADVTIALGGLASADPFAVHNVSVYDQNSPRADGIGVTDAQPV